MENIVPERPRVNLRKENRVATEGIIRSITPEHLMDEVYPNEKAVITNSVYADTIADETPISTTTPVRVSKIFVYANGERGCFLPERTRTTAVMLQTIVKEAREVVIKTLYKTDRVLSKAFTIKDNKVYLQIASRDGSVKYVGSSLVDDIQLFVDYITHPNSNFMGLCWLLEERLPHLKKQQLFFKDWMRFLGMIEQGNVKTLETYILKGSAVKDTRDLHNLFYRLVSLESMMLQRCATTSDELSKTIFKGLYDLLMRETSFKVNPLFLFVMQNFYADIPENIKLKNTELHANKTVHLRTMRADLEIVGRNSKLVGKIVPTINKLVAWVKKHAYGINAVISTGVFLPLAAGMGGIMIAAEFEMIAGAFFTALGVGSLYIVSEGICCFADFKAEKQELAYRVGGLQLFAEQHPMLPIDEKYLLK